MTDTEAQLSLAEARNLELEAAVVLSESRLREVQVRTEEQSGRIHDMQREAEDMKRSQTLSRRLLLETEATCTALENRTLSLQDSLSVANSALAVAQDAARRATEESREKQTALDTAQEELKALRLLPEQLQERDDVIAGLKERVRVLDERHNESCDVSAELQRVIASLRSTCDERDSSLADTRASLKEAEGRLLQAAAEGRRVRAELAGVVEQVSGRES